MPTKFSEIYERAIFKFKDYSFINAIADFKEAVLQQHLLSALTDFQHVSKVDITKYNLKQEEFVEELGNEEIEILALGISFYWLSAQVMNRELFKNRIHNSDYTSYSPANLLKEMQALLAMLEQNYRGKINVYSYRYGDIGSLKV